MEAKHTPGPWVANCDIYPVMVYRESEEMEFVANTGESKANARLIAAAPDMLAALREIEQWTARWANHDHPVASFARLAIAKATAP